ncbi:MAG: ribosome-associated translation inhibitor RaiA [Cytophagales bacterium]|nr:ribosome-associated translation inhibitor RaiA [Cytophagales bacterium]
MKVNIQSIHFDADGKLLELVQKKLNKLDTFYDRIIDADVYLKIDKDLHQENKIIECKINIPGQSLFVKERSRTFEVALDESLEALKAQLKKFKEKAMV